MFNIWGKKEIPATEVKDYANLDVKKIKKIIDDVCAKAVSIGEIREGLEKLLFNPPRLNVSIEPNIHKVLITMDGPKGAGFIREEREINFQYKPESYEKAA